MKRTYSIYSDIIDRQNNRQTDFVVARGKKKLAHIVLNKNGEALYGSFSSELRERKAAVLKLAKIYQNRSIPINVL